MKPLVLIAGATGYVGGELLKKLLDADFAVRCLARRPEALRARRFPGSRSSKEMFLIRIGTGRDGWRQLSLLSGSLHGLNSVL